MQGPDMKAFWRQLPIAVALLIIAFAVLLRASVPHMTHDDLAQFADMIAFAGE
jgi:hypothetical protein